MTGADVLLEEDLPLEYHRKIYSFILNNPGIHLRRMERDMDINIGTLRHHLRYLEKKRIIISRKEDNLKTYYVAGKLDVRDKEISSLLQQKRFRDIILMIILEPGIIPSRMSEELDLKSSTLSKYMKILEDRKIIFHEKVVRERHFYVHDEKKILEVLRTYRRSFWDSFVDNMLRIYFER